MRARRQARCAACCRCGSASASTRCFCSAGNRLLIDPDTMWQITVGQWILDHRAVPETDVYSFTMRGQPWISTQWLAQVVFAKSLCDVRLERAGGAVGRRDRGDLRAVREIPEPASERKHHAGVRRRGAGADRAASAGAAACAGDAGHGGVGRRTDRGRRSARGAVVLAAAADGAVGQPAWRFCLRPGADRADRARCGRERRKPIRAARWRCAGRRSAWPRWSRLLHALWLEFAAGVAEDPRARQRAAADHGMAAGGFRQRRAARDLPAAGDWGLRCGAASSCRRCASCCCWVCCTWRCRRDAPAKFWRCWRRWFWPRRSPRRSAATRSFIRAPRRPARGVLFAGVALAADGGNLCLCLGASLRAAYPRLAGRGRGRAEEAQCRRASSTTTISAAI